jgi:hypothetical protein
MAKLQLLQWLLLLLLCLLVASVLVHAHESHDPSSIGTALSALKPAFEQHSLLLKSKQEEQECLEEPGLAGLHGIIPTVSQNDTTSFNFQNLFRLDNLDTVLSQPHVDFKLVKKVMRDGKEWLGVVPPGLLKEQGPLVFYDNGYSLVINKLESQWAPVARVARLLELEFQLGHVSCNLYLTPPNASGFEAHWDWMDVIVLQLKGEKMWSVGKEPTVPYATQTLKRQPSDDELQAPRYTEFLLQHGDMLYIPRGTLHNASSLQTESLHVTFGIEPTGCLVADWLLVCFEEELHPLIHNASNHLSVMRRSIPFGDAWMSSTRALFQKGLIELKTFASTDVVDLKTLTWDEALAGLEKLRQQVEAQRRVRWERNDALRAKVGQSIDES